MMPKLERLQKFRNDSVDEVDTTDLENWSLKGRTFVEPFDEPDDDTLEYKLFLDGEGGELHTNFVSDEQL